MFRFNTASKKHLFYRIITEPVRVNLIVNIDVYQDTHKICPVLHEIQIKKCREVKDKHHIFLTPELYGDTVAPGKEPPIATGFKARWTPGISLL